MESRASVAELATSDATTARVVVVVSPLTRLEMHSFHCVRINRMAAQLSLCL
jgi:hypothetical protein